MPLHYCVEQTQSIQEHQWYLRQVSDVATSGRLPRSNPVTRLLTDQDTDKLTGNTVSVSLELCNSFVGELRSQCSYTTSHLTQVSRECFNTSRVRSLLYLHRAHIFMLLNVLSLNEQCSKTPRLTTAEMDEK